MDRADHNDLASERIKPMKRHRLFIVEGLMRVENRVALFPQPL
jgi:hypothetical protein